MGIMFRSSQNSELDTSRTDLDVINPSMHIAIQDDCNCLHMEQKIRQPIPSTTRKGKKIKDLENIDNVRTLPRISASHAGTNFKEIYNERERTIQPVSQNLTVKSTKDLKNSRAFQNTAAGTSEDDSQFKGMTPVSRGTRNTMNIRTQRANFAITNERLVVSGERQKRIKQSDSMPDSHNS